MKTLYVKIAVALVSLYTILLSYWMLIGFGRRYTSTQYMINLKPFETIAHFLQFDRFNTMIWATNLIGNIVVFAPFGVLLPIIFDKRFLKPFLIFFIGLFILESLQLLTRRGSFDIDDFILNSVGFLLGYGIFKLFDFNNLKKSS